MSAVKNINLNTWINNGCFEVEFTTPVTFEGVNSLVNLFREAVEYQKCTLLKVVLNSPGGQFSALQHYIWHLKKWRNDGVKIETEGMVNVASAAAVMLALGEIGGRKSYPHTELVFHYARLSQVNTLTAEGARFLSSRIDKVDEDILDLVSEHILQAVDGDYPRQNLKVGKTRFNAKKCINKKGLLAKIKTDLDRLFSLDEPITAEQAYQFYLIDEVVEPIAIQVNK